MFAFGDTPFDLDYPIYTRANVNELLPHPVTPLAWSVVGPGFEEGFRISFCDDFGLVERPGPETPYRMVGRFAARLHLNLSVMRTIAERLPGTSADVIDVQYFGDAVASGLPGHEASGADRRFKLKGPPTLGRTLAGIGRRVVRDRAAVDEAATDAPTSDAELVAAIRRNAALFARVLGTHVSARALSSPLLEQATHALERGGVDPRDALRYVAHIPDLESAKPSRVLADIAATIPAGSGLLDLLADPEPGAFERLATADLVGSATLHERLTEFVATFGHRGYGEFDPTVPVWEQRPDDVVRLLAHVGPLPPVPDPPEVDPGRLAKPLIAAARSAMFRAERTKDTTMRITNVLRRLVFALEQRLDVPQFTMWTLAELETLAHGGGAPADAELERRAVDFAAASAFEVAEWSSGSLRAADQPAAGERSAVLVGIAGSPGRAVGPVRVLRDPYDDFADGDVLVAGITDTAWTPLFLAAAGVVTDVGGVLSHATIVARDLGVPAVVNTKTGTTALRDGDVVEVDGTAGTVTVLERP